MKKLIDISLDKQIELLESIIDGCETYEFFTNKTFGDYFYEFYFLNKFYVILYREKDIIFEETSSNIRYAMSFISFERIVNDYDEVEPLGNFDIDNVPDRIKNKLASIVHVDCI